MCNPNAKQGVRRPDLRSETPWICEPSRIPERGNLLYPPPTSSLPKQLITETAGWSFFFRSRYNRKSALSLFFFSLYFGDKNSWSGGEPSRLILRNPCPRHSHLSPSISPHLSYMTWPSRNGVFGAAWKIGRILSPSRGQGRASARYLEALWARLAGSRHWPRHANECRF